MFCWPTAGPVGPRLFITCEGSRLSRRQSSTPPSHPQSIQSPLEVGTWTTPRTCGLRQQQPPDRASTYPPGHQTRPLSVSIATFSGSTARRQLAPTTTTDFIKKRTKQLMLSCVASQDRYPRAVVQVRPRLGRLRARHTALPWLRLQLQQPLRRSPSITRSIPTPGTNPPLPSLPTPRPAGYATTNLDRRRRPRPCFIKLLAPKAAPVARQPLHREDGYRPG